MANRNRVLCMILSIAATAAISSASLAQVQPNRSSPGVTVSTDMDCVVAIDGKVVGRIQKDHKEFFPASRGNHTLSAATTGTGDYWEMSLVVGDAAPAAVAISFAKVHAERETLEKNVSVLQKQVSQEETELKRIQDANETASRNAELTLRRRQSVVEGINYYSDRWGKETGMRDNRNEERENLNNTMSDEAIQNTGNTDTTSQAATEAVMGIQLLWSWHLKRKAHRNDVAAVAASARMQYLGKALEDPLNYAPDAPDLPYLAIVKDVKRKKNEGKLLTAPDRIEYSDSSGKVNITCATLLGASGSNKLHLKYAEQWPGKRKPRRKSLVVQAMQKSDRKTLLGEVYLACPKLTQ